MNQTVKQSRATVLLVDDEQRITQSLMRGMRNEPFTLLAATSAAEALDMLDERSVDIVVSDERMPGMKGSEFLALVKERHPSVVRMMLSGQATLEDAVRAINDGEVYRFFIKPVDARDLVMALHRAVQFRELAEQSRWLLARYREQQASLDALTREEPGLLDVRTDDDGAIVLEDDDSDLDSIVEQITREIRSIRAGSAAPA